MSLSPTGVAVEVRCYLVKKPITALDDSLRRLSWFTVIKSHSELSQVSKDDEKQGFLH